MWRSHTLKCLCSSVEAEVREIFQPMGSKWGLPWDLLYATSGRRKLCIMPCHSFHIYRAWRSKEVRGSHHLGWHCKLQGADKFYGEGGSHHVILLYWNFILSLSGQCKIFYRTLSLFPILLLFYLFCTYLLKLERPKVHFRVSYSLWD